MVETFIVERWANASEMPGSWMRMLLLLWWWLFPECFANSNFVPSFNTPSSAPSFVSGLGRRGARPWSPATAPARVYLKCRAPMPLAI